MPMIVPSITQTGKRVVSSSTIFSYWLTPVGKLSGRLLDTLASAMHRICRLLRTGVVVAAGADATANPSSCFSFPIPRLGIEQAIPNPHPRRAAEQTAARGRGRRARETEAMEQAADGAMRRNLGVGGNHEMLLGVVLRSSWN